MENSQPPTPIPTCIMRYITSTTRKRTVYTVSGTYYRYKYRDDHFIGTIRIPGYRECTCDYTFKHDNTSYFVDEAGQPMGSIQQSGIFESIKVSENNYNLVSE